MLSNTVIISRIDTCSYIVSDKVIRGKQSERKERKERKQSVCCPGVLLQSPLVLACAFSDPTLHTRSYAHTPPSTGCPLTCSAVCWPNIPQPHWDHNTTLWRHNAHNTALFADRTREVWGETRQENQHGEKNMHIYTHSKVKLKSNPLQQSVHRYLQTLQCLCDAKGEKCERRRRQTDCWMCVKRYEKT